jgi:hypothetical protein
MQFPSPCTSVLDVYLTATLRKRRADRTGPKGRIDLMSAFCFKLMSDTASLLWRSNDGIPHQTSNSGTSCFGIGNGDLSMPPAVPLWPQEHDGGHSWLPVESFKCWHFLLCLHSSKLENCVVIITLFRWLIVKHLSPNLVHSGNFFLLLSNNETWKALGAGP